MQRESERLCQDKSYNVKEVSEILGISPRVTRDRIRNKELLAYSEGRELRVLGQHITDYRLSKLPSAGVTQITEADVPRRTVYNIYDLDRLFKGDDPMRVKKVGIQIVDGFAGLADFFMNWIQKDSRGGKFGGGMKIM